MAPEGDDARAGGRARGRGEAADGAARAARALRSHVAGGQLARASGLLRHPSVAAVAACTDCDDRGRSALHLATTPEAARAVLGALPSDTERIATLTVRDPRGDTPPMAAARRGCLPTTLAMLDAIDSPALRLGYLSVAERVGCPLAAATEAGHPRLAAGLRDHRGRTRDRQRANDAVANALHDLLG